MQSKYGNANLLLFLPSAVANNHLGKLHSDLWGRLQWRDPTLTLKPYLLILYTVILGSAPQGPINSIPNLCIWRISTTLGRNLSFHSSTIEVILQADIWTGILNCTLNNQCWAKLFHSPKKPAIERVTFGHRKNLKIFPFTIVSAMSVFSW